MNGMDGWLETTRGYLRCADIEEVYVEFDPTAQEQSPPIGGWMVVAAVRHRPRGHVGLQREASYDDAWAEAQAVTAILAGVSPVSG